MKGKRENPSFSRGNTFEKGVNYPFFTSHRLDHHSVPVSNRADRNPPSAQCLFSGMRALRVRTVRAHSACACSVSLPAAAVAV